MPGDDLFDEPYYAGSTPPPRLPETQAEERLRKLLGGAARETVTKTVARFNQALRQEVRSVTALKLVDDAGTANTVAVSVIDGMPPPLAQATKQVESWQWWLALHRVELERADDGLGLICKQAEMLTQRLGDLSGDLAAVDETSKLIRRILKHSIDKDVLERFGQIRDDVFGAYWIHSHKIQLYWMPLAVFASILEVKIEDLTAVVLCHELVHAYTHLGSDIDGGSWNTQRFMQSDVFVTEGLAQFYTERVMRSCAGRLPEGLEAFERLRRWQSPPYTEYQNWMGREQQATPEAVRLAMLQFRNASPAMTKHEEFVPLVRSAQKQLRGGAGASG